MTNRSDVVQSFIESFRDVLATMAMTEFEVKEIEPARSVDVQEEIAASIGLAGASEGVLIVAVSLGLARQIVARMLQVPEDEFGTDEALDGIGELVNMIAGGAKRLLADTPLAFSIGLPTVISGATGTIRPGRNRGEPGSLVHASAAGAPLRFGVWLSA